MCMRMHMYRGPALAAATGCEADTLPPARTSRLVLVHYSH
jgi:hypothetical protein